MGGPPYPCVRCGGIHATYRDERRCFDEHEAAMTDADRLRRHKEADAFATHAADVVLEGLQRGVDVALPDDEDAD